jgi:Zn-dependent M28 family amino/carboxypeptidase
MNKYVFLLPIVGLICSAASCKTNNNRTLTPDATRTTVPTFDADSAYRFVEAQTEFGPRVPGTPAHTACGDYIAAKLTAFGAEVTNQYADMKAFDGSNVRVRNIIGAYNTATKKRVALFAHWDSRRWADNDPDPTKHHTPILGANDGASGVGVLLEIARHLRQTVPAIGIDIILFDAEDGGVPKFETAIANSETSWCLGSQYWARNPHVQGYNARFGILLDMVGGRDSRFLREYYSEYYAKDIDNKVWETARSLGYNRYFVNEKGAPVTDDHYFVNLIARIPTVDVIATDPDQNVSFFKYWHTINDTMDYIDRNTLKAVGQTVMAVIYNEK